MIFSVVIPLFNKSAYISLTLQSVVSQTCKEWECIVVNDGSTDDGPSIVQDMANTEPRIRLLSQTNAGVSVARNSGIIAARGNWVAFLDADDFWHPEYLALQLKAMEIYPDVDMVATRLRRIQDAVNWSPFPWTDVDAQPTVELVDNLPHRWMQGIPFFTSSIVVRKTLLLAMQPCFPVGESQGEDLDLWFRVAERTAIAHTQMALVAYRTAANGSLTSQHVQRSLAPYLLRMQRRAQIGDMPVAKQQAALLFVGQQHVTLAREALMCGDRWDALKSLWRGRYAACSKRWLMSLVMVGLMSPVQIQRWERWRNARITSA